MSASLPACSLFREGNATALLTHHSSLFKIYFICRTWSTGLKIKGRSKAALPVLQLATPPSNRRGSLKHRRYCVKRERKHKDSDKKYFKNHKLQTSLLPPSTSPQLDFPLCPVAVIMLPPSSGIIHWWQEVAGPNLVSFRYKEAFSGQSLRKVMSLALAAFAVHQHYLRDSLQGLRGLAWC